MGELFPFRLSTTLYGRADERFLGLKLDKQRGHIDEIHMEILFRNSTRQIVSDSIRNPVEIKYYDYMMKLLKGFVSDLPENTNWRISFTVPVETHESVTKKEYVVNDFQHHDVQEWLDHSYRKAVKRLKQKQGKRVILYIEDGTNLLCDTEDLKVMNYEKSLSKCFEEAADQQVFTKMIHLYYQFENPPKVAGCEYFSNYTVDSVLYCLKRISLRISHSLHGVFDWKVKVADGKVISAVSSPVGTPLIEDDGIIIPDWKGEDILCSIQVPLCQPIGIEYSYRFQGQTFKETITPYENAVDFIHISNNDLHEAILLSNAVANVLERDGQKEDCNILQLLNLDVVPIVKDRLQAITLMRNDVDDVQLSYDLKMDEGVVLENLRYSLRRNRSSKYHMALPDFHPCLHGNDEIAKLAIQIWPSYLWKWERCSNRKILYFDRDEALVGIRSHIQCFKYIDRSLITRDFIMECLEIDGRIYDLLGDKRREYLDIAIKSRPEALFTLQSIDDPIISEFLENRDFLHTCPGVDFWKWVPEKYRMDLEYVYDYMETRRLSYADVFDVLCPRILERLISRDYRVFWRMPIEFRSNVELALVALRGSRNAFVYQEFNVEVQGDRNVLLTAYKMQPKILEFAPLEMRDTKSLALELMAHNGMYIYLLSEELQEDREVLLAAMNQNVKASMYAPKEFMNRSEVWLIINGMYYHLLPNDSGSKKLNDFSVYFE
jgi:hypothetical protein